MERPWIEHDGSGCPFPNGTLVDRRYADGLVFYAVPVGLRSWDDGQTWIKGEIGAWGCCWTWLGRPSCGNDIVAYRLANDPEAEARRERYTALFDGLIKTAPLDLPVQPEKERV